MSLFISLCPNKIWGARNKTARKMAKRNDAGDLPIVCTMWPQLFPTGLIGRAVHIATIYQNLIRCWISYTVELQAGDLSAIQFWILLVKDQGIYPLCVHVTPTFSKRAYRLGGVHIDPFYQNVISCCFNFKSLLNCQNHIACKIKIMSWIEGSFVTKHFICDDSLMKGGFGHWFNVYQVEIKSILVSCFPPNTRVILWYMEKNCYTSHFSTSDILYVSFLLRYRNIILSLNFQQTILDQNVALCCALAAVATALSTAARGRFLSSAFCCTMK